MPSKDGVRRLGAEDGKIKYLVRLLGRDPVTKKKIVDTERIVYADGMADAHRQRKQLTEEAVALKLGQSMGGGKLRFREAVDLWIKTVTRHTTHTVWKSYGKRAAKDFGDRWLHKITKEEWQRWHARQVGADSTLGGIKMMLMNLYDWAIDHGHAASPNPIEGWRTKRKRHNSDVAAKLAEIETPKKRALTAPELSRYLSAHAETFPHTYPLVLTMLAMGLRFAEASALRYDDIDWATGAVTIRRGQAAGRRGPPKGDKARPAALAASVLEVLRAHVAQTGNREWVFKVPDVWHGKRRRGNDANGNPLVPVWSYSTINRHMTAAMAKAQAKTDNVTHAMRHTLKGLMEGEVPDAVLRKVIGHSSEEIHAKYGDAKVLQFAKTVEREIFRKKRRGV